VASWGAIVVWTGFHYSAVEGRMTFAAREGTWPWSTGSAWGVCHIRRENGNFHAGLEIIESDIGIAEIEITREE